MKANFATGPAKWGIGIHDVANASILPSKFHNGPFVHTGVGAQERYGRQINAAMKEANKKAKAAEKEQNSRAAGQAVIREELRKFGMDLVDKSGDIRAKDLQKAINMGSGLIGK